MKLLLSSLACLALASCVEPNAMPDGAKSKYMETTFAGASMKKGETQKPFVFRTSVVLLEGAPSPAYATFHFDNPVQPSKPFVVKSGPPDKNRLGERTLEAETPRFERITNNRNFSCSVDLFSDAARTKKIDRLTQEFRVAIAPGLASALGVADKID